MSRLYDPECRLEKMTREHLQRFHGDDLCGKSGVVVPFSCTAPRGHGGYSHISTSCNGAIIQARWTDGGKLQERYDLSQIDQLREGLL